MSLFHIFVLCNYDIWVCTCFKNDQNLDRQLDQLKQAGCNRIYQEKMTGTKKERPELTRMMDSLREGDTIIVCELTRLSRSVKDLFELVERINEIGADIKSLKEPWLDTTTPHGRLLFSVFSGVSQFERDIIRERTLEGISAARARGRKGEDRRSIQKRLNLPLIYMIQGLALLITSYEQQE